MSSLAHLRRLRVLGQGAVGKVYLVEKSGKQYALKVEYILPVDVAHGGKLDNEIRFSREVSSRHPDKFMQLLDYSIRESCDENLGDIEPHLPEGIRRNMAAAREGRLCVYKLYTLVDAPLENLVTKIGKWSMPHRYSLLLQILDVLRIFDETKWVHGDLHAGNMAIKKVPRTSTVQIENGIVATYGTLIQTIDLGDVLHPESLHPRRPFQGHTTETELQHYQNNLVSDRQIMFSVMFSDENYWKFRTDHDVPPGDYDTDLEKVKELPQFKRLRKLKSFAHLPDWLLWKLLSFIDPEPVQRLLLGEHFVKVIQLKQWFPRNDILYAFKHYFDTSRLLNYFFKQYENTR